ncbi:MAG: hypothetical protein M3Y49_03940 [Actinomycetota bacterium]|nr:hypothetical protein [Actinomycetota bacterium]
MTTNTAALISRLHRSYPNGAPSDEQVRAQEVTYLPAQWARRWPIGMDRPGIIDGPDPASVTRADLFGQATTIASEADAVAAFVAICAWGTGTSAPSVSRCAKALADPKLGPKLLAARDLAVVDPLAAYMSMMQGGENKVAGLGPAFFTKWLHFSAFDRCEVHHRPLILDALVAVTLGWHTTGWAGSTYAAYLDIAEQVRQRWCPDQPSYTVEYGLFQLRATERRRGWP